MINIHAAGRFKDITVGYCQVADERSSIELVMCVLVRLPGLMYGQNRRWAGKTVSAGDVHVDLADLIGDGLLVHTP